MNYAKAIIMGRLARTVEDAVTTGGTRVVENAIGVTFKKDEPAIFISVKFYGDSADALLRTRANKGDCLLIEGDWRQSHWDDKDTGKKRVGDWVRVNKVQLVAQKKR